MNSLKLFKEKSLKWQLLRRLFLLLIIFLILLEVFQFFFLKQYLCKSQEMLMESRINIVSHTLQNIKSEDSLKKNAAYIVKNTLYMKLTTTIIDKNGKVILSGNRAKANVSNPELSPAEYRAIMHRKGNLEGYTIIKDKNDFCNLTIWRKIGGINSNSPSGLIQLSTPFHSTKEIVYRQLYIYIVASIMILILAILIGGMVINHTLNPLFTITSIVKNITAGDLNKRLPTNNNQVEIDQLSTAFNEMLSSIETSFKNEKALKKKMQQFISDASHELRTPLTSIRGFVEVLLLGSYKDEKKLKIALNSILSESERLSELVNNLLTLTRLDRDVHVEFSKQNMKDIIEEIYPGLKILAAKRKVNINLNGDSYFLGNKNQIKQVIFNIVQNSINHTDNENGVITLSLSSEKNSIILKLQDNGSGIPKEDLDHIFDRFFRSEHHRSRKSGGYGLGLSIVKSIIENHNGKISAESEVNHGTSFYIYLNKI
ncbi:MULTISPECIES: sensor histidine kinase [Clostridium]|uniref:sensor histidine kinase n=1 Tax=Clostridium TaxID=1485 RepID=UPI0008254DFC|nr:MULTISPECIES: HAMP domain-containing sensor histidine kinase [Clostridium]PJI09313.1 sensor histidine kinase [Clostridium sp. CT7]